MTPRADLGGRIPRQLLHGAHSWLERVTQGQQRRLLAGAEMVALPTSLTGYAEAPLGSEEVIIYFDLCRELIEQGWRWCLEQADKFGDRPARQQALASHLREVKQQWLNSSYEGGSPPRFIIECSRRRVPRASGVPIVGMSEMEPTEHLLDCNCPICRMMAEGKLGPSFDCLSGYHLELDEEFAFSLCETREEWEVQQGELGGFSNEQSEDDLDDIQEETLTEDEFTSAWSGQMTEGPLPGDPQGHLKLAFLLAEIISWLEAAEDAQAEIEELNSCFTDFRHASLADLPARGRALTGLLEALGEHFPDLIPRIDDFQCRIDEQLRCPAGSEDPTG
jgi:hypothetical protein